MSEGHVPLDITTGILPAPGGSSSYLQEEGFPTLGWAGVEMAITHQLGGITQMLDFHATQPAKQLGRGESPRPGWAATHRSWLQTRSSDKSSVRYLQPTVDLGAVQQVADARGLPTQSHLIARASFHPAQRHDLGDGVGVAKEAEGDALALARLQLTVQRQDIENLQAGRRDPHVEHGNSCTRAASPGAKGQTWLEGPLPHTQATSSSSHPPAIPLTNGETMGKTFSHSPNSCIS